MKNTLFILMGIIGFLTMGFITKIENTVTPVESLYKIQIQSLQGDSIHLSDFEGKKILFVNVASKCGYTPQYEGLQKLLETYGEKLIIIGVPCNQFMSQEPGNPKEIESFCTKNYGVTFLMTEKIDVKGKNQHPLYAWLTDIEKNGSESSSVKWNFQKYLINEKGELEAIFGTKIKPMSEEITNYFND